MKTLMIWIIAIAVSIFGLFFNGWLIYSVYELAIVPFAELFYIELPLIHWTLFVLIPLSIRILSHKKPHKTYELTDKKLWTELFSSTFTKLYLLVLLYIMNLICF